MKSTLALYVVAFAFVSNSAFAQSITISGCPEAGVEASCIIMKVDDKVYNVTHATPKPDLGRYGTVSGSISTEADICQQAEILSPSTWTPDPAKNCPNIQ